jgi:hypothetical protein
LYLAKKKQIKKCGKFGGMEKSVNFAFRDVMLSENIVQHSSKHLAHCGELIP